MFAGILAHHSPIIPEQSVPPAPPPAPPAPAPNPQPPGDTPIAFAAVTRASLYGVVGSPISSTTLATITCADSSMTVVLSETVPGLTFNYAAGVLSVSGTPTTPTGVHRVVASYVASDGSHQIRGSTSHTITVVSSSEVLTIGGMGGASGKVGSYIGVALALPSANYAVDVTITARNSVPGCAPELAWTKGVSSASGTLSLYGTPTAAGSYSLQVDYWANGGILLGTSTHAVVIAEAYSAPAPTPSPAPAPPAPAPSPPPAPTPAPAPGLGPDPLRSAVKLLMPFDADLGITHDRCGNAFTNYGATLVSGAVGQAAYFSGGSYIAGAVVGLVGRADEPIAVECMVDLGAEAYTALTAAGSDFRWCPVIQLRKSDGTVIWALGFFSIIYKVGTVSVRQVRAGFYRSAIPGSGYVAPLTAFGPLITARPGRFVHLAACTTFDLSGPGWDMISGCWFDGASGGLGGDVRAKSSLQPVPETDSSLSLRIGGASGQMQAYTGGAATVVPFVGAIDEVRGTAADRYSDQLAFSNVYTLPADKRVIPWPNY